MRSLSRSPRCRDDFTLFWPDSCAAAATQGWTQKKSPGQRVAGPGRCLDLDCWLVAIDDGNRFVHMMVCAIDMHDHAIAQTTRFGIIFFLLDVVMSLVQKLAGLVQSSSPRIVRIHSNVVSNVLAIVKCGAFDFVNGMVNFFDGGALFRMQCASVGTFQVRPRVPQVRKG